MKVWTQAMFDAAGASNDGSLNLGTGDFRAVNFGGKHRVVIGPHSILGNDVQLGAHCEIGHHSEVGRGFESGLFLNVGEHVRFGEWATVGEHATIGANCTFGNLGKIGIGTQIGDGVTLPMQCMLFEIRSVAGRSLIKISTGDDSIYYAFVAITNCGQQIYVSAQCGFPQRIEDYERMASNAPQRDDERGRWAKTVIRNAAYFRAALAE